MRILYVGPLERSGTCYQRMLAIKELGHEIISINTRPEPVIKKEKNIIYRIVRKIAGPLDLANANKQLLNHILLKDIDLIWIDKGLTIRAKILEKAKNNNIIVAGYSPDDMLNPQNQSFHFIKTLPLYNIYLTTKSYNVEELKKLGCSNVVFVKNAFCPDTHRIYDLSAEDKIKYGGDVGFIGSFEKERAEAVLYLAEQGINVRIWGDGAWNKLRKTHSNLKIEGDSLWAEDYAKALSSFKINLCFLRKINRDLQTTRSIEIPACGGFMLAERTNEHLDLFKEAKEADFFSDNEELLRKVQYYLEHSQEREAIAKAGHQRCIDEYSNPKRLKPLLDLIYDKYLNS